MAQTLTRDDLNSIQSLLPYATDEEQARIRDLLRCQLQAERKTAAEACLAEFTRQAWSVIRPGTPLVWERHLDAICDHLEAVSRRQIHNLIITLPPGCTKSILCGVMWPAWTWIGKPWVQWLTGSNEDSLAIRDAVACRNLIRSDWYQANWGDRYTLAGDQNLKSFYETTARGHRWTITTNSNVTGKKGNILLLDDPNDAATAESEAERQALHKWLDEAWYDRVNDYKDDCRVVIGQRTGENDGIGHLLANGGWDHLCLPEEFEPKKRTFTSIGWTDWRTQAGDLLRPERYGPTQVGQAKQRLKAKYYAQHQQDPVGTAGERFQRAWFRYYHRDKDGYLVFPESGKRYHPEHVTRRFLTVDQATTVKQLAKDDPDDTVISAWGYTPCGLLVWLACSCYQVELPDIPPKVGVAYTRWKASKAIVEGGGPQKGGVQLIRRHQIADGAYMNVVEFLPGSQDKLDRAADALGMMEAGRIWMPADDPAFPLGKVEAQLLRFTGDPKQGGHDDIVDTLSVAAKEQVAAFDRRKSSPPRIMVPAVLG